MAFCTKCGRELAEGEVCNCSASEQTAEQKNTAVVSQVEMPQNSAPSQAPVQPQQPVQNVQNTQGQQVPPVTVQPAAQQPAPNVVVVKAPSPFANYFIGLWKEILAFIKAPISQVKAAQEGKNFQYGLTLLAANAIISFLVTLCMVGGISFGISISGLFLPILLYFAFSGLAAMFAAIAKEKVNFLGIMSAMGLVTIPLTALGVVNIFLSLISMSIGLFVSIISLIIWVVFAYEIGKNAMAGKGSEMLTAIYIVALGLGSAIVLSIFGSMAVAALRAAIVSSISSFF